MLHFTKIYRFEVLLLLTFTVIFCFSLSLLRFAYTGSMLYLFLNWNLLLAILPCIISSYLVLHRHSINRYSFAALSIAWLLLFPNSPYILTDLFHLHRHDGMPQWYDLIMILSFAWAGLLFGFMSLFQIEKILLEKCSAITTNIIVVSLLFMAAFGVYVGRFLRWNSWDIVSNPLTLGADIADRFVHPFDHGRTWGLTLFMGSLLSLIYFSAKMISRLIRGH